MHGLSDPIGCTALVLRRGGSGRPFSSMSGGNAGDGVGGQRHTADAYAFLHSENRHDAESPLSLSQTELSQKTCELEARC